MNILVAYETNQELVKIFREKGHNAFSCDENPCTGGKKEWHIEYNVLHLINGKCRFVTQNGANQRINTKWDLIIAFPPNVCNDKKDETIKDKTLELFTKILNADCDKIAVKNIPTVIKKEYKEPTQTFPSWWFGDLSTKNNYFWLKGLEPLKQEVTKKPPKDELSTSDSLENTFKAIVEQWGV